MGATSRPGSRRVHPLSGARLSPSDSSPGASSIYRFWRVPMGRRCCPPPRSSLWASVRTGHGSSATRPSGRRVHSSLQIPRDGSSLPATTIACSPTFAGSRWSAGGSLASAATRAWTSGWMRPASRGCSRSTQIRASRRTPGSPRPSNDRGLGLPRLLPGSLLTRASAPPQPAPRSR